MLTVGKILKKKRKEKGIDLEIIEKELKIRKKLLKAVEEDDWDKFVSRVYAEGVVKSYAKYLGIPKEKILPYFRRDYSKYEEVKFREKIPIEKPYFPGIRWVFIISFLLLSVFFGWQIYLYFKPPQLEIISPKEMRFKTKKKVFLIKGKVEKDTEVKINGEVVLPDKDGFFEKEVVLFKGENKFLIQAKGANGRESRKEIFIIKE